MQVSRGLVSNMGKPINVLVIDNYDSFTYNLVHFLGELGAELEIFRNDKITLDEIADKAPEAIVLSPGPCTPDYAGICLELIKRFGREIPIFGVCLGMQSIAQAFGGKIISAPQLMHGSVSPINNIGKGVFEGLETRFDATRYHSLAVERGSLPNELELTAEADDGSIMGLQHKVFPIHGVQFHPESIASENGHELLKNFLDLAIEFNSKHNI